jgi:hypothetical protein
MSDNTIEEPTDIKDRVLGKIRRGEVAMHSSSYFLLKLVALVAVVLLALGVSILICTFILFTVRINIHDAFTHTGPSGWWFFARFFPWHLLVLDVILIALAEWLMRSFRFAYRSPTLYLLFALVALALALGLFIDRDTSFNNEMLNRARLHHLPPPLDDMYVHAHRDDLFPPQPASIILIR